MSWPRFKAPLASDSSTTIVEVRDVRWSKRAGSTGRTEPGADFISKYSIALKEARETLYWLRLLDASGEISNGACKTLLREADEIARVIASIIVSANKGTKG